MISSVNSDHLSHLSLYFHIPFCRHACSYCDFFFVVDKRNEEKFFDALKNEIKLYQKYYLFDNVVVDSIYFGGGTPSWVYPYHIKEIIEEVKQYFYLDQQSEITLEANPDDLDEERLSLYEEAGINRISVGIQSFHQPMLDYLNRTHNYDHAKNTLSLLHKHHRNGLLTTWNMDLIYGIPGLNTKLWKSQLEISLNYKPPHISLYSLTVEPHTSLAYHIKKSKLAPHAEQSREHFLFASNFLAAKGYDHYEISNFAHQSNYAKHNLRYWQYQDYLGFGPGAYSFINKQRYNNLSKLQTYIKTFSTINIPKLKLKKEIEQYLKEIRQQEKLTIKEKFNEYLMVTLRTKWGFDCNRLVELFPEVDCLAHLEKQLLTFNKKGWIKRERQKIFLTQTGWLMSDFILRELFL